ncbi:MAG TPA: M20/M25/M40 family metallo-hydrolase [Dyella sp.]|uniref:M20/M25/M40 family metallo-hydrolase n=1 Tax=Dyella sp. TaxID=1869338 RepID=UPI002D7724FD|nr:M20/M25/M40 family metallo-hydrolase [Dyella sp.]HET6554498.1 M20/M25/M40 family metallo-hydrolase [Dyella sp.]
MSRTLLATALAAVVSLSAFAATPSREQAGLAQIREADLRADIGFLASDPLEGRLSLQPGDDVAVQWIASEFAKAGLKPAATDAQGKPTFLQAVPLVEYRPDAKATRLTLKLQGKSVEWKDPEVAGSFSQDVDVDAPLVFAGYGITAPELGYDDYAGLDAKGKVVVVFDHEPQEKIANSTFNGTGNTRYATTYVKVLNAQEHGAVAVLVAPEPSHNHPSAQEIRTRIGHHAEHADNPIPAQALADNPLHIPSMVISAAVSAQLLAPTSNTPAALQNAIDQDLKPRSQALAESSVSLHLKNSSRREATTWNVVGMVEGSDPKLLAETIIISGHHDHDGESGGKIWHGADDNASGTVGVVTLARAFAANPAKPRRSVLFAVFAAEERGLLGAYYLAAHPLRPLDTTRAMINFDMIGRDEQPSQQTDGLIDVPADTTNRLNLIGAAYSPDYQRTVAKQNEQVGLVLDDRFDHEYALNVFFRSDQFPFVLHNVPAFWWFTGFHPDYHHPSDTADKIDYPKMAKILKLAYLSAWQFADEATPPRFVAHPGR